jgi:hypothetical protein
MKAVVLLSKTFFPDHPRSLEETQFDKKVMAGLKIHTCRKNYEYWAKKIARLKEVGGVLSIRQWSGKPYRSSQETIVDIPAEFVGVQKLTFERNAKWPPVIDSFVDGRYVSPLQLANNDGLSMKDFEAWFKGYDLSEPLAIIHFTNFRY